MVSVRLKTAPYMRGEKDTFSRELRSLRKAMSRETGSGTDAVENTEKKIA